LLSTVPKLCPKKETGKLRGRCGPVHCVERAKTLDGVQVASGTETDVEPKRRPLNHSPANQFSFSAVSATGTTLPFTSARSRSCEVATRKLGNDVGCFEISIAIGRGMTLSSDIGLPEERSAGQSIGDGGVQVHAAGGGDRQGAAAARAG